MLFCERYSRNGHVNLYTTLVWFSLVWWGVSVILNDESWRFKF